MSSPSTSPSPSATKPIVRLRRSRFATDDQHLFVERWINHRAALGVRRGLTGFMAGAVTVIAASLTFGLPELRAYLCSSTAALLVVAVITRLFVTSPRANYVVAGSLWWIAALGFSYALVRQQAIGASIEYTFRAVIFEFLIVICGLVTLSFGVSARVLFLVSAAPVFTAALLTTAMPPVWAAGLLVVGVGVMLAAHWIEREMIANCEREFLYQRQIAPKHVLRHMHPDAADIRTQFKPEQRHCVCLCSDWRGYQKLTGAMTAEEVAGLLNRYYDMADKALSDALPEGNYYTDWIADELFVVIYAPPGVEGATLVEPGIRAAIALVKGKDAFVKERGIDLAIDVGLAYGMAFVGLMGPTGFPKATALGEVPGRARRVQGLGKLMRHDLRDADRIIFGTDVLMPLRYPFAVVPWKPADYGHAGIRDLSDDTFYFVEPGSEGGTQARNDLPEPKSGKVVRLVG